MATAERDDVVKTVAGDAPATVSFTGGRYVVRRLLGEGGQKTVYLAHDTQLDREVAVALLKPDGLDATGVARVQREAQATARLGAQAHIVTIFDIGEHEGRPFTVCEYMSGGDLNTALRQAGGFLPIDRALQIGRDICRALVLAHNRGILHRDIKPANIWLTEQGTAKLGDFGLAISLGRSRVTQAGTIMGTAAYMAPEQALGADVDHRVDLYSLGCVLYEMITGRPPFLGDDTISVVTQHISTAPVAPSWHQRNLPEALERLTLRLLSKTPEQRPQDAAEVLAALDAITDPGQDGVPRVAANPLDSLAGGVFVGREQELAELRSSLEEGLSGRGRLILLGGEPGIGKTRLAEELATYARVRGAQVLWGRCYEGEGAPAYWPWIQAIRSYAYDRAPEALRSELGTGAADIAQIVSEVRDRLPGLPPPPALEPEQARFRLFDSITTFLKNASQSRPLVLLLDDLHWSDKPTLLLLQFLARELRDARLVVLATYRDVDLGRQHPLSHTLAELAREQLSQRLTLRGLAEDDVARFIEMTAGVEPPPALVTTVYHETEGNPFFVKEIVNLLAGEGRLGRHDTPTTSWTVAVPQSVREVVARRLDHLSQKCNKVLTSAAVIGREFDVRVLQQVSGMDAEGLLAVIEEALAARVLAEVPQQIDRYSFSHGLIRETLYEELTATRRVRLHQQIGNALEQLYGSKADAHLPELAYHFGQAARGGGNVEKAIDYAVRAGERALGVFAWEEASDHFQRALETLELKSDAGDSSRCELLLKLGEAQNCAGDAPAAKKTLLRAAHLAEALGAADQLAKAAVGYVGRYLGTVEIGNVDKELVDLLERALDGLGEDDGGLRIRIMARLATELYFFPDSANRRDALSQQAVAAARQWGDPAVLAEALRARHIAVWSPDNLDERLSLAAEVVKLAAESGDLNLRVVGHNWLASDLLELGQDEPAYQDQQLQSDEAPRRPRPDHVWPGKLSQAMNATLGGDYEEAERLAQEALVVGQGPYPQTAVATFGLQIATIRRDQGRFGEMEDGLKGLAAQYPAIPGYAWSLPTLYSETGRDAEAKVEFERLAANNFEDIPRDALWFVCISLAAETCTNLGDAERAALLYDLILPFAKRNIAIYGIACWGSAERLLGRLAATLGRSDEAEIHFQAALAWNRRIGSPPWVARTQLNYASMLIERSATGDREQALRLLTDALEAAQQMGMKALVDRAIALKLQLQGVDSQDVTSSLATVAETVQRSDPTSPSTPLPTAASRCSSLTSKAPPRSTFV